MGILGVLILFAIACAIIWGSYHRTRSSVGAKLGDRMGAGEWKFSESWASTLTALGGILGSVLTAQLLPSETATQKLTNSTFVGFNLMFTIAIVVAAALYNTFRSQRECVKPTDGTPKPGETPKIDPPKVELASAEEAQKTFEYQGKVVYFLLASTLVLWAVFGQLLTAWLLLDQVPDATLSNLISIVFRILLVLAAVLALVYGYRSVPWTLRNQAYKDEIGMNNPQKARTRSSWYLI